MPSKSKQDYLDIAYNQGDNRTKIIADDAVSNKSIDDGFIFIRHMADGTKEVCLRQSGVDKEGVGANKAEATADAASKF